MLRSRPPRVRRTRRPRPAALRLLVAAVALALLAGACSGGDDGSGPGDDVGSPTSADSSTSGSAGAAGSDGSGGSDGAGASTDATAAAGLGRGGTATVAVQADPTPITGWTPWGHICAWACRNVLDHVLETLTVVTPNGRVEPWLAESVTPNGDLTAWTVVLRDDITFSDGQALTAEVVKNGHEEFIKEGTVTEGLLRDARVVSLQVVDDRTLTYELSEPNGGFPAALAGPAGRVFSVDAAQLDAAAFVRAPVGTGPFVFDSWDTGGNVVLRANPDYWRTDADGDRLPYLDELRFVEVEDEGERLDLLRDGQADIGHTRAPRSVQSARDLQFTVVARVEDNIGAVVFNNLEPPFDDSRVRRALLLASDQNAVLDAGGVSDISALATQWWSPESVWYSERTAESWPGTDLETAVALLREYTEDPLRTDELDVAARIEVRVQCTDDLQLGNMMRELERQWEATGLVDVTVDAISRSGLLQRVMGSVNDNPSFSGDFDATCWRLGGESDPWVLLTTSLGPVKTSPLNVANIENESLLDLVALLQTASGEATRRAAIEQIMISFSLEVPAIYLGHAISAVYATADVEGIGRFTLPDGREVFGQLGSVGRYDEVRRS